MVNFLHVMQKKSPCLIKQQMKLFYFSYICSDFLKHGLYINLFFLLWALTFQIFMLVEHLLV